MEHPAVRFFSGGNTALQKTEKLNLTLPPPISIMSTDLVEYVKMSLISLKCQYALRAVFELAKRKGEGPVKIGKIAEVQTIPHRFLESILNQLRQSGIVESRRGKDGGYFLARDDGELTVGEVIRIVQGSPAVVDRALGRKDQHNALNGDCVFSPLWERHSAATSASSKCARRSPMI